MYTEDEIQTILWNHLTVNAKSVDRMSDYTWKVIFEPEVTLDEINDLLEELNDSDLFEITYTNGSYKVEFKEHVLEFHQFRQVSRILENKETVKFDDSMVKRLTTLWNFQSSKYHSNAFFKSVFDRLVSKKELSKKQYDEFKYLLDNGRSRYEAGLLGSKN